MSVITHELPLDGLPLSAELPDHFSDEECFWLTLKLFDQGRIPSGKAGRLDLGEAAVISLVRIRFYIYVYIKLKKECS
ncbi:MAG: hypothetical protein G8237_03310 [Magnetococcales bacterium]|nr:hypothetical protein [Magnetococcales bacterium]